MLLPTIFALALVSSDLPPLRAAGLEEGPSLHLDPPALALRPARIAVADLRVSDDVTSPTIIDTQPRPPRDSSVLAHAVLGSGYGHLIALGAGAGIGLAAGAGGGDAVAAVFIGVAAAMGVGLVAPPMCALRAARSSSASGGGHFALPLVTHLAVVGASLAAGAYVHPMLGVATYAVGAFGAMPYVAVRTVAGPARFAKPGS